MNKIHTGFSINPYVGSLTEEQPLCRYVKIEHFLDLLKTQTLWFTRISNWQLVDRCEGEILPVFKKYLASQHKNPLDLEFHTAVVEQGIKTNFGCCFSIWDGEENDHMWQVFTPKQQNYGVIITINAGALYKAINTVYKKNSYLSKVKYLTDNQAKSMKPHECYHSNKRTFIFEESHFLKRVAYKNEKEVRAIISLIDNNWTTVLHKFIKDKKIQYYPPTTRTPKNCIRIDMYDSQIIRTLRDRVVFLNNEQISNFIEYIKNNNLNVHSGVRVPISLHEIKKIILHSELDKESKLAIKNEVEFKKLNCEITISNLSSGW